MRLVTLPLPIEPLPAQANARSFAIALPGPNKGTQSC